MVLGLLQLDYRAGDVETAARFRSDQPAIALFSFGAGLFRRRVFERVGLLSEDLRNTEDADWFMRAREAGATWLLEDQAALIYRRHGTNMTEHLPLAKSEVFRVLARATARKRAGAAPHDLRRLTDKPLRCGHGQEIGLVTETFISVVIPAFNAAPFLAEALESALGEMPALSPGKGFEILVVDDGSKDATPDIAARYAARGVRCLRRSIQGGIGAARNTGMAAAQGELLAFLDADDLWPAGRLALLVAALDSAGAPAMVFGHLRQFACPSMSPDARRRLRVPAEPIAGYCAGAMLLRRSDFLSVGAFNETLKVGEFIDWFARARDRDLPAA